MKPQVGDRVRVTGRMDDPHPLPVGAEGTVDWVGQWQSQYTRQVGVKWDNGRVLMLIDGDPFVVVPPRFVVGERVRWHSDSPDEEFAGWAGVVAGTWDEDGLPVVEVEWDNGHSGVIGSELVRPE